jgi:hypothetical protein
MVRSAVAWLLLLAGLAAGPAAGADAELAPPPTVITAPPPAVAAAPPAVVTATPVPGTVAVGPLYPAPEIRFGCHRVWRCDNVVCEWRRGCWGIYGYMEGPYYTAELARRQWESQGLAMPRSRKHRSNNDPY